MQEKNEWIDLSVGLQKFQALGRDHDAWYQTHSYGELRVLISRWNIKI